MKIVFLDIETTGLDFEIHMPIEIAMVIKDSNHPCVYTEYSSAIYQPKEIWDQADKKALEINGFLERDIKKTQFSCVVAEQIQGFLTSNHISKDDSFFMCQNPSFDRVFFHKIVSQKNMEYLQMPYHWLDLASMYWIKTQSAKITLPEAKTLSKDTIATMLKLPREEKPHTAVGGVRHLISCYETLMTQELKNERPK